MAQVVDVFLRKLKVNENGEVPKREARNLLTAETWPEEVAKVPGIKTLRLRDDESIDFTKTDRVSKMPFTKEQVLLVRRELTAPVELKLTLASVYKHKAVEKFLASVFKGAFKVGWTALSAGIGNVIGAAVTGAAAQFHLGDLEMKDQIFIIGEGSLELDPTNLPAQPVSVPLFVTKPVTRIDASLTEPKRGSRRRVTVLEPDPKKPNATVTVEVVAY